MTRTYVAVPLSSNLLALALDDSANVGAQNVWLVLQIITNDSNESNYALVARVADETTAASLVARLNGE